MSASRTVQPPEVGAIMRAAEKWADSLIDRSGRNELLFCKERSKLLLDNVSPEALDKLLRSRPVKLRELFPDEAEHKAAAKTAESIRKRIKEYHEERGVRVGRVVYAFASWRDQKDRTVRAPVLLRDVTVSRTAQGFGDHEITADQDLEVNPVMLTHLESTFRVGLDSATVDELNDFVDEPDQVEASLDRIRGYYAAVPEFTITPGVLVGTFHYAKLAMYQDLKDNALAYANNVLFAAIAGDPAACAQIRRQVGEVSPGQPDRTPPQDEFLVLDADPSQNYVINAAVAGRNLVVQGPPGTGKSQTISNIIATLTARGQKVLFVAEKRAAIDAVLGRLNRVELGNAILDLHLSTANRAAAHQQFRDAIAAASRAAPVNRIQEQLRLARVRDELIRHTEAMHTPVAPWDVTVFDAQTAMIGTRLEAHTTARIPTIHLRNLAGERQHSARDMLGRLVDVNGILPANQRGPWGTAELNSMDEAHRAREVVRALRHLLPDTRATCEALARAAGIPMPDTPTQAFVTVERCARATGEASRWRPDVWTKDLARLLAATGDSAYRRSVGIHIGFWERRRVRKQAASLRVTGTDPVHQDLATLAAALEEWRAATGIPRLPTGLPIPDVSTAMSYLGELSRVFGGAPVATVPWFDLVAYLDVLSADAVGPARVADARQLQSELDNAGLDDVLDWIIQTSPRWPESERRALALAAFDFAWFGSVLDEARIADPNLASFTGRHHATVAEEFIRSDRKHIESNGRRVSRILAERLTAVRSARPEEDMFLDKELTRKRKLKTIRELMERAPNVLLAAKPCWAMSPLLVSQMLPPRGLFDVVIFDEASQVQPAEAMPSLARGRTAIVAGDTKQLPPTTFFEEQAEESEEDSDDDESLTSDVESILDAFNRALGQTLANEYYLGWHYRSEDARLIAFSNASFYDNQLTTFPGTAVDSPLRLVEVTETAALPTTASQPSDAAFAPEVGRVVELALEHARTRPDESLGIIALSLKHATRIETALNRRLQDEPELRPFFDDGREEAVFIKNLERVQGDERDAIILSAGFAKVSGRLYRRFGPINLEGGDRRLNVAITRAKRRMALVTSFGPADLDPEKVTAKGASALAKFVRFAANGGLDVDGDLRAKPMLNPFEISVRDRLVAAGVDVACQWGVAGYFIDFAAKHPRIPGRLVLAIEADGASYHWAGTARARDRLRQEHLERLGWRFHRIWSTDWFNDPDGETQRALKAYEQAVAASDAVKRVVPCGVHPRRQGCDQA